MPALLVVGLLTITALYFGHVIKRLRLPSIVGFMIVGVILGPSVLNIIDESLEKQLSFMPQIALGLVALSIGMELRVTWLRKQGSGIVLTVLGEGLGAFIVVFVLIYAVGTAFGTPDGITTTSQYIALALLFGVLATATAPAGTAAIIREYKARGSLTQTLYAVVGFDDALAVMLYGFGAAVAQSLLANGSAISSSIMSGLLGAAGEVILSLVVGAAVGVLFCMLARGLKRLPDMLAIIVGFVLVVNGLCAVLHTSFILTNMAFGFIVTNTQPHDLLQRIRDDLGLILPLFFIFLFGLAGANLHIAALPHLGLLGLVYILARSAGKIFGARLGTTAGGLEEKVKKYLGLGLLSQAGVAIGLALLANQQLRGVGGQITTSTGETMTSGDLIGSVLITTITATSIIFEIIGPILAKYALTKAGEIPPDQTM